MKKRTIIPIILCGGIGTRLWPLSRASFPKQFLNLGFEENRSLLQNTALRIKDKNRFFRKVENYKYDTSRKLNHGLNNFWKSLGNIGVNFLNIFPKLGSTIIKFFGNLFTFNN